MSGFCSDTNWHTMLYLIRLTFSTASGSSKAYLDPAELLARPFPGPSEAGKQLLETSRQLFRRLADDGEKGRKERGFLLGLLEIAREYKVRDWEEGKLVSGFALPPVESDSPPPKLHSGFVTGTR